MSLPLPDVGDMDVTDLARLPATDLAQLQITRAAHLQNSQWLKELVDAAIALKYAALTGRLHQSDGEPAGELYFEDHGVAVHVELPTTITWDQSLLAASARRITESGEDPCEFIDVTYRVAESTYHAWPASLQASFAAARQVTVGPPVVRLSQVE